MDKTSKIILSLALLSMAILSLLVVPEFNEDNYKIIIGVWVTLIIMVFCFIYPIRFIQNLVAVLIFLSCIGYVYHTFTNDVELIGKKSSISKLNSILAFLFIGIPSIKFLFPSNKDVDDENYYDDEDIDDEL